MTFILTMTKIYIVQEYYDDVVCLRIHKDKQGNNRKCGQKIHCSRRIHYITTDLQRAITDTQNKPTWSYEEYELQ